MISNHHFNACKGCSKRHFKCHKDCPEYLAEKQKYEADKEEVRKKKRIDNYYRQRAKSYRASKREQNE